MSTLTDLLTDCTTQQDNLDYRCYRIEYYSTTTNTVADAVWATYNMMVAVLDVLGELVTQVDALTAAAAAPRSAARSASRSAPQSAPQSAPTESASTESAS